MRMGFSHLSIWSCDHCNSYCSPKSKNPSGKNVRWRLFCASTLIHQTYLMDIQDTSIKCQHSSGPWHNGACRVENIQRTWKPGPRRGWGWTQRWPFSSWVWCQMSRCRRRHPSAEWGTRLREHRDPQAGQQWTKPLKSVVCGNESRALPSPLPAAAQARIYSSSEPAGGLGGGERQAAPQPRLGEEKYYQV